LGGSADRLPPVTIRYRRFAARAAGEKAGACFPRPVHLRRDHCSVYDLPERSGVYRMLPLLEPLTEFVARMLPAARRAGYKLVLTLLAREADSEAVYRQIERHWNSLDDVTGEHVLFVLGASGVGEKKRGIQDPNTGKGFMTSDAVIKGRRSLYWPTTANRKRTSPLADLVSSHTSQISSLRVLLQMAESERRSQ